jgi:CRP-like cAMP-binding protein
MDLQIPMTRAGAQAIRGGDLLAHTPLFRGLSPDEISRIAAATTRVHVERGRILFQRGDPCLGFHIIVYGQVKLAVGTPGGAEKVVEILGPGRSFGEAVMFMDNPYFVTATALADTLLLHVPRAALMAELERDPRLARRMLASLSMRLHSMVRDMEAMTLHSGTQRVIAYLEGLAGQAEDGCARLPAQKSIIASRLDLTPEYFSRILHDLAAAGLVRVDNRDIHIIDAEGLRAFGREA